MNHILWAYTSPQRLHNLNLQMGSVAALQLQDPAFDPKLWLLSVQSFPFSSCVSVGVLRFPPMSVYYALGWICVLFWVYSCLADMLTWLGS